MSIVHLCLSSAFKTVITSKAEDETLYPVLDLSRQTPGTEDYIFWDVISSCLVDV